MRIIGFCTWLPLVLCGALLTACGGPVSVIEEQWAPDRRHKAVVFTTSGGGVASDLHTSVSVLRPDRDEPGWPPNTFTALHQQDDSPAGAYFGPRITVRWLGPSELEISYDPRASTLRRYEEVDGVRVVYRVAEQEHAPTRGPAKR
jgi:hypothetical protein